MTISAPYYQDNFEHLADELRKLDLLIQRRVMALRLRIQARQEMSGSGERYISHAEVDLLLRQDAPFVPEPPQLISQRHQLEILQHDIDARVAESLQRGFFLALPQLAHLFALSAPELQAVIICMAPELRRKYDQLYAYLQDDITRKKPSIDLILQLLCDSEVERWKARTLFSDNAPLLRFDILQPTDDPQSPSGSSDLARFLKLSPRILSYLLENNHIDACLVNIASFDWPSAEAAGAFVAPAIKSDVGHFIRHYISKPNGEQKRLVLYFHGPDGVGKRALAPGAVCNIELPTVIPGRGVAPDP